MYTVSKVSKILQIYANNNKGEPSGVKSPAMK